MRIGTMERVMTDRDFMRVLGCVEDKYDVWDQHVRFNYHPRRSNITYWTKLKHFHEVSCGQVDLITINLQVANLRESLRFITSKE